MKTTRRILTLALAALMVLALAIPAFATPADGKGGTIKIEGAVLEDTSKYTTYTVYKMFDVEDGNNADENKYRVTDEWVDFVKQEALKPYFVVQVTADGTYMIWNKNTASTADAAAIAEMARAYVSDTSRTIADVGTVTVNGNVLDVEDNGYYLLVPSNTTASGVIVVKNEEAKVITEKSVAPGMPTVEKKVYEDSLQAYIPASYNNIPVTQVLENGFKNLTGITSVTFPDTLLGIGRYAFQGCTGIATVEIPSATKFIGAYAFYGAGLTSATLDTTGRWIVGIDGLTYVRYDASSASWSNSYYAPYRLDYSLSTTEQVAQALIGPVSVKFYESMYTDNSYTTVNKYWFTEDWTNGTNFTTAKPFVVGQSGGEGIIGAQGPAGDQGVDGKSAYELYCEKYNYTGTLEEWLASLKGEKGEQGDPGTAGRGIVKTEIIDGCLWITYSDNDTPVNIGSITETVENTADLNYVLLNDGTYGVKASATFSLANLVIPETYNDIAVTQILDGGFKCCGTIQSVSLPTSLKKIGRYAFYQCYDLTTISIPENVSFIGKCAFKDTSLVSAEIGNGALFPNVTNAQVIVYYAGDYIKFGDSASIPARVTKFDITLDPLHSENSQNLNEGLPHTFDFSNSVASDKAQTLCGDIWLTWSWLDYHFRVEMNWCDYDWIMTN